jgi:hypothetical protein
MWQRCTIWHKRRESFKGDMMDGIQLLLAEISHPYYSRSFVFYPHSHSVIHLSLQIEFYQQILHSVDPESSSVSLGAGAEFAPGPGTRIVRFFIGQVV